MAMETSDYDFIDPVPDRFICSLCTNIMKDPHLVVCCGQKFCASCLQRWLDTQTVPTCPHCRASDKEESPFHHVIEKGMKSEIESLRVRCSNFHKGCGWTGEIREHNKHLQSDSGCDFVLVACPNGCYQGKKSCTKLLRKNLSHHLQNRCQLRILKCMFCFNDVLAKDFRNHLSSFCEMYPVECPNKCGEQDLVRKDLDKHRDSCMCEFISCEYVDVGCKENIRRKDMLQHIASCQGQHLEMTKTARKKLQEDLEKLQREVYLRESVVKHELKLAETSLGHSCHPDWIASLKTQFQIPLPGDQKKFVFRMLQFKDIMSNKTTWCSPEFEIFKMTMFLNVHQGNGPKMLRVALFIKQPFFTVPHGSRLIIQIEERLSLVELSEPRRATIFQVDLYLFDLQTIAVKPADKFCIINWDILMDAVMISDYVENDALLLTVSTETL